MKTLIAVYLCCISTTAFPQLRKEIDIWLEHKAKTYKDWSNGIPYNATYDTMNIGLPMPGKFNDPTALSILRDTFAISNPLIPLKVQALALQKEQVDYKYSWSGVGVAYGMMPFSGNYWEDISLDYDFEATKKYLFYRLIRNRPAQNLLYQWAKPTMTAAFKSKPDTAQALDMFAVWKAVQYLTQYDHEKEKARATSNNFTVKDWRGKDDSDSKLYAFWHRRIEDFKTRKEGCSLEDARFWIKVAAADMWTNSSAKAKSLLGAWQKQWQSGKIQNPKFK